MDHMNNFSDESEDDLSFHERVKRRRMVQVLTVPKTISPKKIIRVHSISDSEESDLPKKDFGIDSDDSLPDLKNNEIHKSDKNEFVYNYAIPVVSLSDSEDEMKNQYRESANIKPTSVSDSDSAATTKVLKLKNKARSPKIKDSNKELEKERKRIMREEKKKEKELAKILKETEKEIVKNNSLKECINNMSVVLDHNIIFQSGCQDMLTILDQNGIKYSIEENDVKHSVLWFRTITNATIQNGQVVREESRELQDTMILFIPNEEFLKMIHSFIQKSKGVDPDHLSLSEYIVSIKSLLSNFSLSCVIVGLSKFMRDIKERNTEGRLKYLVKQLHKNSSEEAVTELQIEHSVSFHFLDDMTQFGRLLRCFTKAIAESPIRKEKQQQKASFSWYADADSKCPVKVSADGTGMMQLWKQQIQQFQNVGPEVAEAITSSYPSLTNLLKAYKMCLSQKEAENLLQDIVVRRNYGPLGTQRRIGPELSYKIYTFFTTRNGKQRLKR